MFGNDLFFSDLLQINNEIDDLMLPYKFDISIFHKLTNKDLIDHINRVGVEVFSKHKSQIIS